MNGFVLQEHKKELVKVRDELLNQVAGLPSGPKSTALKRSAEALAAAIRLVDAELGLIKAIRARIEHRRRLL